MKRTLTETVMEEEYDLTRRGIKYCTMLGGSSSGFGGGSYKGGISSFTGSPASIDAPSAMDIFKDRPNPVSPLAGREIDYAALLKATKIEFGVQSSFASSHSKPEPMLYNPGSKYTIDPMIEAIAQLGLASNFGSAGAGNFTKGKAPYSLMEEVEDFRFQYRAGKHENFGKDHVNIDIISPVDNHSLLDTLHIDWTDKLKK